MERLSADGLFFHRACFRCFRCRRSLRLADFAFSPSSRESLSWSWSWSWSSAFRMSSLSQGPSAVLSAVTVCQ